MTVNRGGKNLGEEVEKTNFNIIFTFIQRKYACVWKGSNIYMTY